MFINYQTLSLIFWKSDVDSIGFLPYKNGAILCEYLKKCWSPNLGRRPLSHFLYMSYFSKSHFLIKIFRNAMGIPHVFLCFLEDFLGYN